MAVTICRRFRWQQITGNLFGQKAIIRTCRIEGVNDVVSITPCMRKRRVAAESIIAVGFSVPSDIEPVPSPAFAELRTREQLIDQPFNCGRSLFRVLRNKLLYLFK